jgi:alanine racemase
LERGLIAEIDLKAVAHNFKATKKTAGRSSIIAVVKADAYGHGAVEVSKKLEKEGASYFAVAYTSEAIQLRKAGIKKPIIVLFDRYEIADYFKYNLIPVIHDLDTAKLFSREALKRKTKIGIHVKFDTGMGRVGLCFDDISNKINEFFKMDYIKVTGLMSHFSDADLSDKSFAFQQLAIFKRIRDFFLLRGVDTLLCHMANSAAILTFPESHLDAVRPGLMLYGYSPIQSTEHRTQSTERRAQRKDDAGFDLKPAMTVKTKIVCLRKVKKGTPISYGRTFITARDSVAAVLSAGYADGYSRLFSNNADILVRGQRAKIIGRVCMDLTVADVTDIDRVAENDEVVLLGRQKDEFISAYELAEKANTIPYEILTSLSSKSKKVYKNGN